MKYFLATFLSLFCLMAGAQSDTIPGRAIFTNGFSSYIDTRFNQHLPRFTVECWAKSPQAPNNRQGKGPVHYEENFQINWDHVSSGARNALVLRDSSGSWQAASFGSDWEAETWYHLAGTFDGVLLKTYRNGKLVTVNPNLNGPPRQETATLKIGKHARLSSPQHEFHEGTTDEVRIWSRALTEQEIRENMHKTLQGTEPGLVLYYQFNEWPVTAGMDSTLEKVSGTYSAVLIQNPERRESTAPVGKGESATLDASTPGSYGPLFDLRFTINQVGQAGQITATTLNTSIVGDTFTTSQGKVISSNYWIVNNDGLLQCEGKTALLIPEAKYMELENFRPLPLWLLHRASNSDKMWKPLRQASLEIPMGVPFVMVEFDTLLEGQLMVGRIDTTTTTTQTHTFEDKDQIRVWIADGQINVRTNTSTDKIRFELIDLQGRKLINTQIQAQNTSSIVLPKSIKQGLYIWRISNMHAENKGKVWID